MIKTSLILGICLLVFSQAECVQVIYRSNGNPSQAHELNMREEQQQILREQLEVQKEMLNVQKEQVRYQKLGW